MATRADLLRLFAYDDWANRETVAALEGAGVAPPRSLRFLAHIVAVQWLWLGRLQRDPAKVVVWPDLELEECKRQLMQLKARWHDYIAGLDEAKLAEVVPYVNSKGEHWANRVEDVLMQVVFHSGYHRGQIATDLRAAGHKPAYTDFIEAVRRGRVGSFIASDERG